MTYFMVAKTISHLELVLATIKTLAGAWAGGTGYGVIFFVKKICVFCVPTNMLTKLKL